jgi:hypothetical protein
MGVEQFLTVRRLDRHRSGPRDAETALPARFLPIQPSGRQGITCFFPPLTKTRVSAFGLC